MAAAACNAPAGQPATATPAPAPTTIPGQSQTTPEAGPTPGQPFAIPESAASFPLDLTVIGPDTLDRLQPIRQLEADTFPESLEAAALALPASFEFRLAALLDDGQLLVWNMASPELIYRDEGAAESLQFGNPLTLALSNSYLDYLATPSIITGLGQAHAIMVRPPDPEQEPQFFSGATDQLSPDEISSLAFSPDGQIMVAGLASGGRGQVKVWDLRDDTILEIPSDQTFDETVSAIGFLFSGDVLAVSVGDTLIRYQSGSGAELDRQSFAFPIRGLSFGLDGEPSAVWGEHIAIIEATAPYQSLELTASSEFHRLRFSPDGRLLVAADGQQLRFWELRSGAELDSLDGDAEFLDAAFLDNGRLLATIDSHTRVLLWGSPSGSELEPDSPILSRANAAALGQAVTLYVPGSLSPEVSTDGRQMAIASSLGILLMELPSLQVTQSLHDIDRYNPLATTTPEGDYVAWVTQQGSVRIWDRQQGRLVSEIAVPDEFCCRQIELAPDGSYLVTLGGNVARVWDLGTGDQLFNRDLVQKAHVSPDGSRLAFLRELAVEVVRASDGQPITDLTGFETAAPVVNTQFAPDWQTVVWTSRATMQFQDVETGTLGAAVPFSWGEFSPRGDRIAAVEAGWIMDTVGELHEIDIHTGQTLQVFNHHEDAIIDDAAYSPDGNLLATVTEFSLRIWNASTGQQLGVVRDLPDGIYDLSFSPDGRWLITVSNNDLIEIWGVRPLDESARDPIGVSNAERVVELDRLELGYIASDAVFSPDQATLAIASGSGETWYWDLETGAATEGVVQHTDFVYRLAFQPTTGSLISVSKDGMIRVQNSPLDAGAVADGGGGEVSAIAILPDGNTVVTSGQDGVLRFWALPSLTMLSSAAGHDTWVWSLAVSPAGDMLASASAGGSVKLWRLEEDSSGVPTVDPIHTLSGHTAAVWGLDFSPDGRRLASASWDRTIRIWDTRDGTQQTVIDGHSDAIYDVAYSPDGALLATGSADGTVLLWIADTDTAVGGLINRHGDPIRSVGFSPDGRFLVSTAESGLVRLWGVAP